MARLHTLRSCRLFKTFKKQQKRSRFLLENNDLRQRTEQASNVATLARTNSA
jgi:hypothetical protein